MKRKSIRKGSIHKAVAYLVRHPEASVREVMKYSGLTHYRAHKLIRERQTPVEVLKRPKWRRVSEDEMGQVVFQLAKEQVEAARDVLDQLSDPPGAKMLKEAVEVFRQRGETYGDAAAHWRDVAGVWTSISGNHINADTAVKMMIALKLLRLKASPNHMDSITDIAGYAAVLANVVSE